MIDLISPTKLTKQLELFRQFLVSNMPYLNDFMKNHDWDSDMDLTLDWIQVNWELLVERELLGKDKYLTPLSTPLSVRITNKNVNPNYSVVTQILKNLPDLKTGKNLPKNTPLRFLGFCSAVKNGFGLYPPFDLADLVLDSTKESFVVPFAELEFYLANF